eukprot:jgi/Ulvmu1/5234/UM022_0027.1
MMKAKNLAKKMVGKDDTSTPSHAERSNVDSSASSVSSSERTSMTTGSKDARAVAVGLPDVGKVMQTATYTDTKIRHTTRDMPVGQVVTQAEAGVDVTQAMEQVNVPKVEMVEETVLVPDVRIEKQHKMMPVTVTKLVPVQQEEVVMRTEEVVREKVVMDKEHVEKPITILKPVTTEVPRFAENKVMLPRPYEVMKKVKVIRPENVYEDITVQQPVARKRMVKVVRPVVKTKKMVVQRPVPFTTPVNITVPEIREGRMEIQVPVTEDKAVEYKEPVTVIRKGEEQAVQSASGTHDGLELKPAADSDVIRFNQERDVRDIPVGLPFTEMVKRAQNFSVTHLAKDVADYRETWMQPMQVHKQEYKMEDVEIEVTETVMEEFEEEIEEIVLEPAVVPVVVTRMPEVEEEWPIVKERAEEVWTSEVFLEPTSTTVPELATKTVSQEVPRTVYTTETVQKPETVEKTVMVEKAFIENRQVSVEVPVEGTREMTVIHPVITSETIEVQGVVGTDKVVNTQIVQQGLQSVPEDVVSHQVKTVQYEQAQTIMNPTAVEGPVKVEGDVSLVGVPADHFVDDAMDMAKGLLEQPGVHGSAHLVDHHVLPQPGSLELGQDVVDVAPDAALPGGVHVNSHGIHNTTDGFLHTRESVDMVKPMMGVPAVIDGVKPGQAAPSKPSSGRKVMPTDVPSDDHKITQTDVEVHGLSPEDPVMSNKNATSKSKKGFFGKVKSVLS